MWLVLWFPSAVTGDRCGRLSDLNLESDPVRAAFNNPGALATVREESIESTLTNDNTALAELRPDPLKRASKRLPDCCGGYWGPLSYPQ